MFSGKEDSACDIALSNTSKNSSDEASSIELEKYSSFRPIILAFPSISSKITACAFSSLKIKTKKYEGKIFLLKFLMNGRFIFCLNFNQLRRIFFYILFRYFPA